jgi:uncharacterized protein (TIGR02246 family)
MFRTILAAAAALALAACTQAPAAPDDAAMIASARAVDAQFAAAFNTQNAEGVVAAYWNSPEVVLMPPDGPMLRGIDAHRESFTAAFAGAGPHPQISFPDPHYVVAGDMVIHWGVARLTIPRAGPDGADAVVEARYTDVKAEKDGKWVYVIDHASMPAPPPPAAAAP